MSELHMRKFIPLTKVDEATHTVYGLVTAESPDKEGELCDYDGAKKAYESWSSEFEKATTAAGQETSFGNIRLQHTITPGGKVTEPVVFDDENKAILLKSTPIDDDVWEKLKRGFFTGYSQGGDYAWRKCNECGTSITSGSRCPSCKKSVIVRYAPIIAEVSYVDNPCHGDAHFELVKTDGSKEIRKFAAKGTSMEQQAPAITEADIARIAKAAADQAVAQLRKAEEDQEAKAKKAGAIKAKLQRACEDIVKSVAERKGIDLQKLSSGRLKKGMYEVSWFAQILMDLAWLQQNVFFETAYEEDGSALPKEMQELLELAAEKFLMMAEEEVEELTAASAEFNKGVNPMNADTNLSKAASAKEHIAKMKKAVSDHHDKMCECHKAHKAEMDEHFAKLHKILGVEEADKDEGSKSGQNEPEPIKPESGAAKAFTQADLDKAVAAAVQKTADDTAKAIIKALKGEEDDGDEDDKKGEAKKAATGIGDRANMPTVVSGGGPVIKVMPVTKTQDGPQPSTPAPAAVDSATISKAMSGDSESVLTFMKTAQPTDGVPLTVAGAMGKMRR